jgi:hypothetical protein
MRIEYQVLAFRQQAESPIQVAFVAHAREVLDWAGVPRKSDELLTGFQRFKDNNRIETQIVPFFQFPQNCSPTAAIVALRSDSGLGRCRLANPTVRPGEVVSTTLTIEVDAEALETNRVFTAARDYVNTRVAADVGEPQSDESSEEEDENEDEEESADNGTDSEGDEELTVHLGSETLARMKSLLDDEANWKNEAFRKAIVDYVKPAFMIDGQHRLFAAARFGDNGLPFMICGLYDAPWTEQVFQFTVVNLKPKRIPPSLIASIAALSLSRREQEELRHRLSQAGVKMTEVEIMSLVAYDDRSPFAELVDMGVGDPATHRQRLGYGSMKRVAKVWHRASRNSLTQIAKQLFSTNNSSHARSHWRTERTWFDFFCAFWDTIKNHYPEPLWQKDDSNKLLVGATLWALQDALLMEADGQMASHWKAPETVEDNAARAQYLVERLVEVINTTLVYLPAEMWTIPWQKASLDTNQGREETRNLFRKLIDEGKREGRVWKNWKKEEWFAPRP